MACPFCQIIAGKAPAHLVYEDGRVLAFLDIRPRTRGHSLVIPKSHDRWVDEVPDLGELFAAAGKVARAAKRALAADWIQFLTIGEEVEHAHIHVIPRFRADGHGAIINLARVLPFSDDQMEETARAIREAVSQQARRKPLEAGTKDVDH